ncbi:major capsid protein [Methylobacterium indicum]|uniref:Phage capsid protein n=1 Tax=Methylobacterium indicum TaxID=1775910 RepID=A0A8H8WSR8_9HYPH|nr:major capsid protein [Methylobacterium indicum]BCM83589.1 phage capsid protein [Methylobacterium indicum]
MATEPQVNLNDTQRIMGVLDQAKPLKTFFMDRFYPMKIVEPTTDIKFDVKKGHRKSAPFVAPRSKARSIRLPGNRTKTFTPPTIKLTSDLNPRASLARMAGEPIGGALTPQARAAAIQVETLNEIRTLTTRSQEHMAIEGAVQGSITVTGEGYDEPVVIDFGRHPDLTGALVGTAQWNKEMASPLADIESRGKLVSKIDGATITDVIMDPEAWAFCRKDPELREIIKLRRATGGNTADIGPKNYNATDAVLVAELGDYRIWVYSDFKDVIHIDPITGQYTVEEGVPVLEPGTVIGVGPQLQGFRLFGALEDQLAIDMGMAATELFVKVWYDQESGVKYMQGQCAPLPVVLRENASWSLKVF